MAEPVGDFLSKKIAVQVQNDLDEYMANNPEFPVRHPVAEELADNGRPPAGELRGHCSLWIARWTRWLHYCMSSGIKRWSTIFSLYRMGCFISVFLLEMITTLWKADIIATRTQIRSAGRRRKRRS